MLAVTPRSKFCRDAFGHHGAFVRSLVSLGGGLRDRRGNPRPLDRRQLILQSHPLQKQMFALAEAHLNDADGDVCNLATALFIHRHRLFTFLEEEGVEPTNNIDERSLRTAVAGGARSASEPKPQTVKSPPPACSRLPEPASDSNVTS